MVSGLAFILGDTFNSKQLSTEIRKTGARKIMEKKSSCKLVAKGLDKITTEKAKREDRSETFSTMSQKTNT